MSSWEVPDREAWATVVVSPRETELVAGWRYGVTIRGGELAIAWQRRPRPWWMRLLRRQPAWVKVEPGSRLFADVAALFLTRSPARFDDFGGSVRPAD